VDSEEDHAGWGYNEDEALGRRFVKPAGRDSRYEKWCRWIADVEEDVVVLALARHVWLTVNGIVMDNSAIPSSVFFDAANRNYVVAQAVAVRRQSDRHPQTQSLARIMVEIAETPEVLSRDRFVGLYPWGMQHLGEMLFDRWAGEGGCVVDASGVTANLQSLVSATAPVCDYVDKYVAHLDRARGRIALPTHDDLDIGVDATIATYRRYQLLLTGRDPSSVVPTIQYDWLAPLRMPWLDPDSSPSGAEGGCD
jgi:hypothetical protein